MNVKLTQWNKFGDHELVTQITNREFEYDEAKHEGAGVINKWDIIFPGQYIVEINEEYIGIISEKKAKIILA